MKPTIKRTESRVRLAAATIERAHSDPCHADFAFVRTAIQVRLMPLGSAPHPGGIADNSPTFKCWVMGQCRPSPEGTVEPPYIDVNRPFGTELASDGSPNVETLGYFRMSLWDRDLSNTGRAFLRSNFSGISRPRLALQGSQS